METDEDRVRVDIEWVLDEAQTCDRKRVGRFLLLGSVSPSLMRQVSGSLAGRLALVELSPFLLGEVNRFPSIRSGSAAAIRTVGCWGPRRFPGGSEIISICWPSAISPPGACPPDPNPPRN